MKRIISVVDEEKNEGKYEFLCAFDSEYTGKSYVIYTEYAEDSNDGSLMLHAGSYTEDEGKLKVDTKLTQEEYDMMSEIINGMIREAKKMSEEEKKNQNNNNE